MRLICLVVPLTSIVVEFEAKDGTLRFLRFLLLFRLSVLFIIGFLVFFPRVLLFILLLLDLLRLWPVDGKISGVRSALIDFLHFLIFASLDKLDL